MHYVVRLLPVGLFSLGALVACTDDLEAPTAVSRLGPPLAAQGPLRDIEIDRTDTHFGVSAVTTTERHDGDALLASVDPQVSVANDEVYLEGGFGADGRVRFTVYFESAELSPRVGAVRLVGSELHTFDRSGTRVRVELANDAMARAGLPGGDHAMALFSATPPTCPAEAPECAVYGAALQSDATLEGDTDDRVVRVRPRAAGGAALGGSATDVEIEQRFRRIRRASALAPEAWRLQEVRRTERASVNGRAQVTAMTTRYEYRTWDRNEGRERARAQARTTGQPPVSRNGAPSPTAFPARSVMASADTAAILGQVCAQGTTTIDRYRPEVTRGYEVVYQHGFCSDASVFLRFDERLAQSIAVQRSRAFSLVSSDPIESQASILRARIATKSPRRHLFIGHSQGGLVVRRLGQLNPELVTGVVTIGTPHAGAHLAAWGPEAAREQVERTIQSDCFSEPICRWVEDILSDLTSGLLLFGRDGSAPALADLVPGSPFLRTLNGTYEPFPRVSIEVDAGRRWALARMIGDVRSSQDRLLRGERPGGDARVDEVERVYATAKFLHHFSMAAIFTTYAQSRGIMCDRSGYATYWPGCTDPQRDFSTQWNGLLLLYLTYDVTGRILGLMDGIDRTWDELTTRRADETDGLINLASQRYPQVPGAFVPQRIVVQRHSADSHAGEMKSPGVFSATLESIGRIEGRAP